MGTQINWLKAGSLEIGANLNCVFYTCLWFALGQSSGVAQNATSAKYTLAVMYMVPSNIKWRGFVKKSWISREFIWLVPNPLI